jgi:hypothetical protein
MLQTFAARRASQDLRQVRAHQVAAVVQLGRVALRAVSVEHFPPFHQVALAPVLLDQLVDVIAAFAVASTGRPVRRGSFTPYKTRSHFRRIGPRGRDRLEAVIPCVPPIPVQRVAEGPGGQPPSGPSLWPSITENEIVKRDLIWIAVAAVAIPLALSVINAQAQGADDLPRVGETSTEYNLRMAKKGGDREVLRDALRESEEKAHRDALRESREKAEKAHRDALRESQAHRDALRESQERAGAASKQYEKAVKNLDQTIKDQKARAERARQIRCNRLSYRASTGWEAANRAARRYEDECT